MVTLFLAKFYNETFFDAMTFFMISVPMLAYLVFNIFMNMLDFIKQLHLDDLAGMNQDEDAPMISDEQQRLLTRVVRDICVYFGVYYLSS